MESTLVYTRDHGSELGYTPDKGFWKNWVATEAASRPSKACLMSKGTSHRQSKRELMPTEVEGYELCGQGFMI